MPDGSEQDGIVAAKLFHHGVRKDFPFFKVAVSTNIVLMQVDPKVIFGSNRMKHFNGFTSDFRASPVSGNSRDFVGLFHVQWYSLTRCLPTSCLRQREFEVLENVFDILNSYRESNKILRYP